jgi:hypothetical protein
VGFRQAGLRFLAQVGPWYLLFCGSELVARVAGEGSLSKGISVALVILGFAVPFLLGIAAAFAPGKRALWDRVARTQVRYPLR